MSATTTMNGSWLDSNACADSGLHIALHDYTMFTELGAAGRTQHDREPGNYTEQLTERTIALLWIEVFRAHDLAGLLDALTNGKLLPQQRTIRRK